MELAHEAELVELISQNWPQITWSAPLKLDDDGDLTGRQFPVGKWNLDFLAVDGKTNDLVVIELKRGKPSAAAVGQLLAYVNRIKAEVATADQKVTGILVAHEIDDKLRYAARGLPNVAVMTYRLGVSLQTERL